MAIFDFLFNKKKNKTIISEDENKKQTNNKVNLELIKEELKKDILEFVKNTEKELENKKKRIEKLEFIHQELKEQNALYNQNKFNQLKEKQQESSKSIFSKISNLAKGLTKTRKNFISKLDRILFGKKELDEDVIEQIEELLVASDVGVKTTLELIEKIEEKISRARLDDTEEVKNILKNEMIEILKKNHSKLEFNKKPFVILVVGVNGTGKTTTIGKIANKYKKLGKSVLLGAADTFRAAAIEQLEIWAKRANIEIIKQKHGSDPSAVAFDTVKAAVSRGIDIVIIDTAGRLHTKVNLMEELKKMVRVIKKILPDAPHEIMLVLDANTGQNAISQAKLFKEAVNITGVVLTKLDGTAKGGIVVAVSNEFNLPVRYIGIGEKIEDLKEFEPEEFVEALFS